MQITLKNLCNKVDNLEMTCYYIKVASSDTWSLKIEQRDE